MAKLDIVDEKTTRFGSTRRCCQHGERHCGTLYDEAKQQLQMAE